jgi:hypothetical protein
MHEYFLPAEGGFIRSTAMQGASFFGLNQQKSGSILFANGSGVSVN